MFLECLHGRTVRSCKHHIMRMLTVLSQVCHVRHVSQSNAHKCSVLSFIPTDDAFRSCQTRHHCRRLTTGFQMSPSQYDSPGYQLRAGIFRPLKEFRRHRLAR